MPHPLSLCIVFMKNGEILVFLSAYSYVKNGKKSLNVIKVNIYAYAHRKIKCFDFLNDFQLLEADKVLKSQENWNFFYKTRSMYTKFC